LNFGDISWNVSMNVDEGIDSYIKEVKKNKIQMDDLDDGFKKGTTTITFDGCVEAGEGTLNIKAHGKGNDFDFPVYKPTNPNIYEISFLIVINEKKQQPSNETVGRLLFFGTHSKQRITSEIGLVFFIFRISPFQ